MIKVQSIAIMSALATGICGCSQFPTAHRSLSETDASGLKTNNGLEIEINPESKLVRRGAKLEFEITARNTSGETIMVPQNPEFQFFWTYKNGRRDNQIIDLPKERFYQESELIRLGPGEQTTYKHKLDTYYFPVLGTTRFKMVYHASSNLNPDLKLCWAGKSISNAFVIHVIHPNTTIPSHEGAKDRETVVSREVVLNINN